MGTLGHNGCAEYPNARDQVFRALVRAMPSVNGLILVSADRPNGQVKVRIASACIAAGDSVSIHVNEVASGRSRITISPPPTTSAISGSPHDPSEYSRMIEQIFSATSWNLECDDRIEEIKRGTLKVQGLSTEHPQAQQSGFWGGSTGGPR